MNIVLRELDSKDEQSFLDWIDSWKNEDLAWATFAWKPGMSHSEHLQVLNDQKDPSKIPSHRVPSTMLYAFIDNQIIGRFNIRHELNDHLMQRGGHIGYAVSPAHRKKGYAKKIFALGLQFCAEKGMKKLLVTCSDENIPSWKIIEKFHGSLENRIFDQEEDEYVRRYWIDVEEALRPRYQTKVKVVGYIVRFKNEIPEILVFDHDKKYADAGTQVPAGTVYHDEDFKVALLREIEEESGLSEFNAIDKIDQYSFFKDVQECFHCRHVYYLSSAKVLPDAWTHRVTGAGVDKNLNFHYYWISIEKAQEILSGRLGDSIPQLQVYLENQRKLES